MHPGILALNQLAAATGIQNFDELINSNDKNEWYDESNNEWFDLNDDITPEYVYFRDSNQQLVQILPERSRSAYYCEYNDCIIAELDEAAVICTKYGYFAYNQETNQRVYSKGNK